MRLLHHLLLILALLTPVFAAADDEKKSPPPSPKPKQFIYVFKLVPRLHDDTAWTDADKKTVGTHFAHLKAATAEGKVLLAGRTLEPGDKTFGLVIFEAPDEPAARAFMNADPALVGQIMTATLHPYQVALQRK